MIIAKDKVVTIDYTLTDDSGKILDKSQEGNFAYLHGANNIIPGLETALDGKSPGEKLTVNVSPEDGYGHRDDQLSQVVPIDMFESAEHVTVGQQFHAEAENGEPILITVTNVEGNQVTIDGNHPLAGINLNFDVEVIDVRDANNEELAHGHVHGPHGHQH